MLCAKRSILQELERFAAHVAYARGLNPFKLFEQTIGGMAQARRVASDMS